MYRIGVRSLPWIDYRESKLNCERGSCAGNTRGALVVTIMKPSVTVVIPTYNLAALLPEAIASVRAQQWPKLEIIVVDDGSTDNTESVLRDLARDGDLRWFRQDNAGAAAARNRGVANATGEWIAFLDADDV